MTTYRVYVEQNGPLDWVEYVEAESEQHAKAQVENDPNDWPYLAAVPLPTEMESECVCSETPVLFKRTITDYPEPYPHLWECQNCQKVFGAAPDEINWEHERMFAEGYVPCGCDHYDIRCRCQGAGWWHPEDDEDGPIATYAADDDDNHGGNPYYEEDGYYEMDDEEDDDPNDWADDGPFEDDDPPYSDNEELLELED